ncbi:SusC/RagA family TonB-linked outer membrane protein [Sphingobacterium tabacisoli]|uniref:SusC/RagA family TonB-linked outer membrane protein n=1 Tax=Sphingobacterium tabacisoli TaxID=2044855 RepID=A0ABW5L0K4_9SPHI|nr:SusC/RagA family TonB-linked outer membrane protein [Sphingobacterium tabacisoli]
MLRLVIVVYSLILMQWSADVFAQRISIDVKNGRLKQILKQIQRQTSYDFMYNTEQLRAFKPVTVKLTDARVEEVLDYCLKNQGWHYEIKNNIVVIHSGDKEHAIGKREGIRGRVLDERETPFKGASIRVKNKPHIVTTSDEEGEFYLPAAVENQELVISCIGYETKEIKATYDRGRMTVLILPKNITMDEVVTTGIFKKALSSFTGAAVTITGDELQMAGTRNLVSSIRNIDPSFNLIENNRYGSNPNGFPEIQIRGNSNIPNVDELQSDARINLNTPLIILDGFETNIQKLLEINENEVELITLLKDASATAIYGSRGANGVVVITTRSPREGKLRITYRADINVELPDVSSYKLLNAADKLELEKAVGYYDEPESTSLQRYYSFIRNEVNSGVNTDWVSLPLRNGIGQRHNLRLDGGSPEFRYVLSAQYNDVQGGMKGSSKKIINSTMGLFYVYDRVKFKNNLMVTQNLQANSPYGAFHQYVRMNPYWRPYDDNGKALKVLGDPGNEDYLRFWGDNLPTNPLYNATLNTFDKGETFELTNNTSVEWAAYRNLLFRAQIGITRSTQQGDRFRPAEHTAFARYSAKDIARKGDYRFSTGKGFRYDASLNLSYNKVFNQDHMLFAGVDYNIRQNKRLYYEILAEGFNNPDLDFLPAALQYAKDGKPNGGEVLSRAVGFTGNLSYSYADRYFADASLRMDGASQFGAENQFAPFWSVGAGWNLHQETLFTLPEAINRLKIRMSTGVTGSQNFRAYQSISTYKYYTDDRYFNWTGSYMMGLGNEELRWQQNYKNNIGIELEMFEGYFSMMADVYKETSRDMVSSVMLPPSNGFGSYIDNIGKMENKGMELIATAYLWKMPEEGIAWSVTATAVRNKNKVLKTSKALKEAQEVIKNATGNPEALLFVEGYSSNTIWAVPSLGIDPSSGEEFFIGKDGKPTSTWNGRDVVAVGGTDPTFFGNFSTMLRYKSFTFNAFFGYRFGGQQYNATLGERIEVMDYRFNMDARVYDSRWTKPGDQVAFKSNCSCSPTYKTSRFVQNERTLSLQNISLRYDMGNRDFLRHYGVQGLIVTANMSDVFYLSTIKRERGTNYPFTRYFGLNFSVTF